MNRNHLRVIIADDDPDDQHLLADAQVANGIDPNLITLVSDGEELITVLPSYSSAPCIVFLDLNMPKKSGQKVLMDVKSNPALNHIPILIFTTSASKNDILRCYQLGCNTFFSKPFSYTELVSLISVIISYWVEKGVLSRE